MTPHLLGACVGVLLGLALATPCWAQEAVLSPAVFVCPHVPPGPAPCRQWVLRSYGEWRDA